MTNDTSGLRAKAEMALDCGQVMDVDPRDILAVFALLEQRTEALREGLELLIRYRNETPLGHQPHMIAHIADAAIAKARASLNDKEPSDGD